MGKGFRNVSFVGRLSLSRKVLYWRFHYITGDMHYDCERVWPVSEEGVARVWRGCGPCLKRVWTVSEEGVVCDGVGGAVW